MRSPCVPSSTPAKVDGLAQLAHPVGVCGVLPRPCIPAACKGGNGRTSPLTSSGVPAKHS